LRHWKQTQPPAQHIVTRHPDNTQPAASIAHDLPRARGDGAIGRKETTVGTWGTGPFDSDGAEDYVDELERMSAAQRLDALEEIFGRAVMAVGDSWREPSELIAAAAVVAANMPLGTGVPLDEDHGEMPQWLVKPVPDELAVSAVRALDAALPTGGWFWRSWTDEGDRIESQTVVANLKAALSSRPGGGS
jgi:hypothetical protein